jgi:rare lipoprotein A (peptidoglycan hydrolase)
MTIKLNGKVVERTSRNDLHNTFSVKHHKPVYRPGYKQMWLNQMGNNKVLLYSLGIILFLVIGMAVGCDMRVKGLQADLVALQSELDRTLVLADAQISDYNLLLTEYASCSAEINSKKIVGKVSFYSKDGCLGCGSEQITASGEKFDENAYTLAIPVEWKHIKMGTIVMVKNLDTGKVLTARVNDRGGFLKYNRVADLSKALYTDLGIQTDKTNVEISY